MSRFPTVLPLFLIESGYANQETNIQDKLYCNQDTQQYQNLKNNGNNQDYKDDFEDKDFWSSLLLYQNQNRKKKSYNNITNIFSNNNMDLSLILKLVNTISFLRTFITPSLQKPIYSKVNQQTVLGNQTLSIFQKNIKILSQDSK